MSKAILLRAIGGAAEQQLQTVSDLTITQIGIDQSLFSAMTGLAMTDKQRHLLIRRRQSRKPQKCSITFQRRQQCIGNRYRSALAAFGFRDKKPPDTSLWVSAELRHHRRIPRTTGNLGNAQIAAVHQAHHHKGALVLIWRFFRHAPRLVDDITPLQLSKRLELFVIFTGST